jgi:hypothetical protein
MKQIEQKITEEKANRNQALVTEDQQLECVEKIIVQLMK